MNYINKIKDDILKGDIIAAPKHTTEELDKGAQWSEILEKAMIPAMDEIGERFSIGEAYLPELIAAGEAMSRSVKIIKKRFPISDLGKTGILVIGTVQSDIHDIGKTIVKMNFEGAGFKVIDLGVDVSPEKFVNACKESNADVVGISALLSTTMLMIGPTIKKMRLEKIKAKIMIGGNPITQEFADKVKADGYAANGYEAVKKAKKLIRVV